MKNKTIGKLWLGLGVLVSLACNCRWFETNGQLQDLYNNSDVVLTGRVLKSVTSQKRHPNANYLGFDILLQVTSVEKGRVKGDTVFIVQTNSNCARPFYPREKVIVFGWQVRQMRTWSDTRNTSGSRFSDDDSTHYSPSNATYALYRRLYARHTTIGTTQCVTFTPDDRLVVDFIRAGKRR